MNEDEKQSILSLYPEFSQVTGPYIRKSDNRAVVALTGFKKTTTRQLAKVRLEVKLGRRLVAGETVDHHDRDRTNDSPDNLTVLHKSTHGKLDAIHRLSPTGKCAQCGEEFELSRHQTSSRAKNKPGPYCSKSCASKRSNCSDVEERPNPTYYQLKK